jgi:Zn-dependent protease
MTGRSSELLLLISYTAIFLNLFNLIPIRPLDGGRVMQVAGGWAQWIGAAVLLGFTLMIKEPSMLLIWILVLQDIKIERKLKAVSSTVFFASMVILMCTGYSHQHVWVNWLDGFLAGTLVITYWIVTNEDRDPFEVEGENYRTTLSPSIRFKWIALYVILGLILAVVMGLQKSYLPNTDKPRPPKGSISEVIQPQTRQVYTTGGIFIMFVFLSTLRVLDTS